MRGTYRTSEALISSLVQSDWYPLPLAQTMELDSAIWFGTLSKQASRGMSHCKLTGIRITLEMSVKTVPNMLHGDGGRW